jgi:uncharacterized protein (DUF433 family)
MSKYIASTPTIMGGHPVLAGTSIPVSRIIYLLKEGYPIEAIHDQYSWVAITTLEGTIDEIIELVNKSPHVSKVS